MKILLWHGYLLRGSGSNVYTANIARSWRDEGHDVLVLCQERDPDALEMLQAPASPGRCTVRRPDIGRVLPVYVYDHYEGFDAKLFTDLTDEELTLYTERNVGELIEALESFDPDAFITGHEVMGPEIARLACSRTGHSYLAKLHGSALEYAVKKQERYAVLARSGLGAARTVVGGSRYMVNEAAAHIPGWSDRSQVVNPGCDVSLFRPTERAAGTPKVGFVGKLIASKGVHDLLAALPLVEADHETTIVGYGGFERPLHRLASALEAGDLGAAREIAESGEHGRLDHLAAFLEDAPPGYASDAKTLSIGFTGRLEHGPLSQVLPTFDVLVVPSVVPEAFGMVAAEAAACGVLPIVPDHSGIAEAGAAIEEAIGRPGLLTYDASDPVRGIAAAIDRVLALGPHERREMEDAAVALAHERWSWAQVARRLLALATDG